MNVSNFGALVAKKRKQAGLTQESFALKLGITAQAVSKWENGIGLPDVTLFPAIASTLGVSIDELFGVKTNTENSYMEFPAEHRGMPFLFSRDHRACYSAKALDRIDKEAGIAYFSDGSTADLLSNTVRNCGVGEITIYRSAERSMPLPADAPTVLDVELGSFCSVSLGLSGCCSGTIEKATDGVARLHAEGSPSFIHELHYGINGDVLTVTRKMTGRGDGGDADNRIRIFVPFDAGKDLHANISGSGDCRIEPSFDHATLGISGSGDITGSETGTLEARIAGSGSISYKAATQQAKFAISGSGDISMERANDVEARIAGSGDISIGQVSTALDVTISGSGDLSVSGEVETLKISIRGSGDLCAPGLTVTNADLNADGSSELHIGHIKGTSVECISPTATLRVDRRG